jgi:hypothetical protein
MTEHQRFRTKARDLFTLVSSATELETRLSMMERLPRGYKMWTQIVFLSEGLDQLISKRAYRIHNHRLLSDGGAILQIVKSIGRMEKTRLDGLLAIVPASMTGIHRVVCISDSSFWHKVGSKFVESSYPFLVRIFFRQAELRNVLLHFEQSLASRFEMAATDITLKEKRLLLKRGPKRDDEFDSERLWTDSSIQRAFDNAEERRQWFKSIRLDVRLTGRTSVVAMVRVTKHGLIAQDHLYDLSLQHLFPNLDKIAFTKTELFAKRGLREREYSPANPVSIDYPMDVFHEKANVRKLAAVLRAYPNSSKALYHGNPYLHVSLADFVDGSSFEIWVLSPRRIIFVPQARTSVPSFEKLVSYLFEQFKEGEAKEYSHG